MAPRQYRRPRPENIDNESRRLLEWANDLFEHANFPPDFADEVETWLEQTRVVLRVGENVIKWQQGGQRNA